MENFWSSLVWQAGGDILSPDKKTVVIDSDQAAAGIQFLQDLIYKDKIMDVPVADKGDEFEQGQAAMEANGSWLVATAGTDRSMTGGLFTPNDENGPLPRVSGNSNAHLRARKPAGSCRWSKCAPPEPI